MIGALPTHDGKLMVSSVYFFIWTLTRHDSLSRKKVLQFGYGKSSLDLENMEARIVTHDQL